MASIAPVLLKNRDRDARLEDIKIALLGQLPLREAQSQLSMWSFKGDINIEQAAMMFMMLNEREAREMMG